MSFKSTRKSRRHRIPRQENTVEKDTFFQPLEPKNPVAVQPKLVVGAPDDKYEREADNVADRVVGKNNAGEAPAIQSKADSRMEKDREIQEKPDRGARPQVQRQVEGEEEPLQAKSAEVEEPLQAMSEEEEEPVQAMEEEEPVQAMEDEEPVQAMEEEEEPVQQMSEEEEPVQTMSEEEEPVQAKGKTPPAATPDLAGRLRSRAGKGRQLEGRAKEKMESGFGRDFSDVNVHTDAAADEMNRELGARAFARGQDVYFKSGEYNPDTASGQRLLAHELTHTVQQGGGEASEKGPSKIQRAPEVPENKYHTLPGFDKMWSAFPKGSVADVKKTIGGKVSYDWIKNTCAIRMSRVLNYTGHEVPKTTIKQDGKTKYLTVTGADKKWYYYRITNLRNFIESQFGPPDVTLKPPYDMGELSKLKGIILFDVDVWKDATGHYTLWNGKTCADKAYFKEASAVHLWTK